VKTIFSGGQVGSTEAQYERHRAAEKRKLDRLMKSIPAGQQLIVPRDYLDFVNGKTPYPSQGSIRKEKEHSDFLVALRAELENDPTIGQLPCHVSISIDGLYVPYGDRRTWFYVKLKEFIAQAAQYMSWGQELCEHTFCFEPTHKTANEATERGVSAHAIVLPLVSNSKLAVSFIQGGVGFNEQGIECEIRKAIVQLKASVEKEGLASTLPVIAVWSESFDFSFRLLMFDNLDTQLGNLPQRYYLFDWAFSEYPDLAAIVLCKLRPKYTVEDFCEPSSGSGEQIPFGYVIVNPSLPQAEQALRAAISEQCTFIQGIATDPLE